MSDEGRSATPRPSDDGADATDAIDSRLVARVAAGSSEALAGLYDRHAGRMLALAQHLLGTRRDAEDLLHDVFLEVWRKAASYDPQRASVRTWLLVRVRSRALDRLRSLAVARRLGLGPAPGRGNGPDAQDPEDPEAGLGVLRQVERSRALDAVAALPEPQRAVVSMSYLEGFTCSEIARRCGLPIGTVKSRLSRALVLLREQLAESEGSGG